MPKIGVKANRFFAKLGNPAVIWDIREYESRLQEVNRITLGAVSDYKLMSMALELKNRIRAGVSQSAAAIEAFAIVREVCDRVLDMRPFDVQIIAGMAMCG